MKAIILAAGIGQRLGNHASKKPKCLLEFGGVSLLERHLLTLKHYRIKEIIVVSGYQSEIIEEEISRSAAISITRAIKNPDYKKGSLISLLTGIKSLHTKKDFILMDADVLYEQKIIGRLINTKINNCFLLDRNFISGDEPVKLCVQDGQLVDFRKQIDKDLLFDIQGESVGFFRFSAKMVNKLIARTRSYLAEGQEDAPYEEIIRDLLLENPENFGYEDITGMKWIEIDFPEDIKRAQSEIFPYIQHIDN